MYINKILFDWDRIDEGTYLRQIDALQGLEELEFTHPITFSVVKMVQVNRLYLRQ